MAKISQGTTTRSQASGPIGDRHSPNGFNIHIQKFGYQIRTIGEIVRYDLPLQAQDSTIGIDMRTDLDHLPAAKQREIERVKAIIFEEFEDALALAQHEWKKKGKIEKIILYGSYARGGWVMNRTRPKAIARTSIS